MTAEVVRASERDVASLRAERFFVETVSRAGEWERDSAFRKARVHGAGGAVVEIDWAADSAFRFFPIERDPALGWRLHWFDTGTNKALTLAARTETRDYGHRRDREALSAGRALLGRLRQGPGV